MTDSRNWLRIAGLVLHILIAALMIFASYGKLFGTPPPEVVEILKKTGLDGQLKLIGTGELITGILLVVPWTASLGVLARLGFWGGTIVTHMGLHDLVRVPVGDACHDLGGRIPAASRDVQQLLVEGRAGSAKARSIRPRRDLA